MGQSGGQVKARKREIHVTRMTKKVIQADGGTVTRENEDATEPLTSKTPFPCIPPRFPMITSTLLLSISKDVLWIKGRSSYVYSHVSSTMINNLFRGYFRVDYYTRFYIDSLCTGGSDEIGNHIAWHD